MPALAQENLVSNSGSAASAGVVSEVGVVLEGFVASLALATALITALLAFMIEDNSASTTSTSATN